MVARPFPRPTQADLLTTALVLGALTGQRLVTDEADVACLRNAMRIVASVIALDEILAAGERA